MSASDRPAREFATFAAATRRRFLVAALLAAMAVFGSAARCALAQDSLPPAEWKAIQRVIGEQRTALHAISRAKVADEQATFMSKAAP